MKYDYLFNKKRTTGDLLNLKISFLNKKGYLNHKGICTGGIAWNNKQSGKETGSIGLTSYFENDNYYLKLSYNHKDEPLSYKIHTTFTIPFFGGKRYWFLCPKCHKRVSILYGGKYFLCRTCHNLTYHSQNQTDLDRYMNNFHKLRDKIRDKDGFTSKPKGMHKKTFLKIEEQASEKEMIMMIEAKRRFGNFI